MPAALVLVILRDDHSGRALPTFEPAIESASQSSNEAELHSQKFGVGVGAETILVRRLLRGKDARDSYGGIR